MILLGDLFDFLFGSVADAVDASSGLLKLIAEKLPGKRFVFLSGNHDHHLVHRDEENQLEAALARGETLRPDGGAIHEPPGPSFFQSFLEARLPGVEIEIAYPTYSFAGVLCTHGHYLDPHARMAGSRGSRLLTRTLWAIAAGGPEEPTCEADYESVTTLLTEWLYIAAQMPHGTHAQQNVFSAAQRAGRVAEKAGAPVRGARRVAARVRDRTEGDTVGLPSAQHFDAVVADEAARQAREQPLAGPPAVATAVPGADRAHPLQPDRGRARGLLPGRRQPRLRPGGRADRLRPHPPAARRRARHPRQPPATGTAAAGSTSPTSPRARPTPATAATPGRGRRS